jgi:hypothetical protein
MKDLKTLTVGQRVSYETINVVYLRTLPLLPDWLKKEKRARAEVKYADYATTRDVRPGHPRLFLQKPKTWTGDLKGAVVIADPDNLAYSFITYTKEKGYIPEVSLSEPEAAHNRYYVVYQGFYKHLWKPLPWEHLRMQLWELDMYVYHSQYLGHNDQLFSPGISEYDLIHRRIYQPKIDPHWKEEYKAEVQQEYELARTAAISEAQQYKARWATPERHEAVSMIRKLYPDYQPNLDLITDYHKSPVYPQRYPDRWFYHYATPEDLTEDPIYAIQHKNH